MQWYCSFLIFPPEEIDLVLSICSDAGWVAHYTVDPSRRYRFSGSGFSESYLPEAPRLPQTKQGYYGKLLVFQGEQDEIDNILDLIISCYIVLKAFDDNDENYYHCYPLPADNDDRHKVFRYVFRSDGFYQEFKYRPEMPAAVAMAAAAWDDKPALYAVHKLAQSIRTESVTPYSMHPSEGIVFGKHTQSHLQHVATSTAINLAFSVIQELQLDVKASSAKPRWLDNGAYQWNPPVLMNLQERLRAVGIDAEATIEWVVRGIPSEVEVHPTRDVPSEYNDGQIARDVEYSFPDAINACEYIRNFMTAHAFGEKTARLGPYEVYNVQQVARQLVLHKLNMWKVWTNDLMRRYNQLGR